MNRIAVALAFDEEAPDILRTAHEFGKKLGAEIHLVHVFPPNPVVPVVPDGYLTIINVETPEEHAAMLEEEHAEIRKEIAKFREADIKAQGIMKPENKSVPSSIIEFANEIKADLIIMGSNRPGRLERLFLGSSAEAVLRQSTIPVLIIPRREHAAEE